MKVYKNVASMNEIINLVKKELKVKIAPLSFYKKDEKGIYHIPEGAAYINEDNELHYSIYCKDRAICKKIHTLLKSKGYYVIWLTVHGGHKVFWLSINPLENKKKYDTFI